MQEGKPIRVFRSSGAKHNVYRALAISGKPTPTQYRYDGVYQVTSVTYFDEDGIEHSEGPNTLSSGKPGRIYQFQFKRLQLGNDAGMNQKSTETLMNDSINKGTLGPEALPAHADDKTLEWPFSISHPVAHPATPVVVSPPQEEHCSSSAAAAAAAPPSNCLEEYMCGEGLSQHFGEFPTPGLGTLTTSPASAEYSFPSSSAAGQLNQQDIDVGETLRNFVLNGSLPISEHGRLGWVPFVSPTMSEVLEPPTCNGLHRTPRKRPRIW